MTSVVWANHAFEDNFGIQHKCKTYIRVAGLAQIHISPFKYFWKNSLVTKILSKYYHHSQALLVDSMGMNGLKALILVSREGITQ